MDALVGAGGWGYFTGGLEAYARGFRFVELNASFYRPVPEAYARRWRSQAPEGFVFSLKANRKISHMERLQASAQARAAYAHDLRIARILRSPFIILETPADLALETDELAGLRELAAMTPPGLRIGLEARRYRGQGLPVGLRSAMEDEGILDVVDVSQMAPRVADDQVYTRVFGPGPANIYQFDDEEVREIDRRSGDVVQAAFAFHGVRMYADAARFLTFKRTGSFPPATSAFGVASLDEVMRPDAKFPATREELERDHGWKVIDLDDHTRAHVARLLETIPSRRYEALEEVLSEIKTRGFWDRSANPGGPDPGAK
jgi:uncharacterized protein YecE (DUF72 family)